MVYKKGWQNKTDTRYYGVDEKYAKARIATLKRDKYKCRMCGANNHNTQPSKHLKYGYKKKSRVTLNVHHIKKWADYPTLRYDLNNLITLCSDCHKKMWGKEEEWEGTCLSLLAKGESSMSYVNTDSLNLQYQLWKSKQNEQSEQEENNGG